MALVMSGTLPSGIPVAGPALGKPALLLGLFSVVQELPARAQEEAGSRGSGPRGRAARLLDVQAPHRRSV